MAPDDYHDTTAEAIFRRDLFPKERCQCLDLILFLLGLKLNYLLYLTGFQRWIVFDELKNRRICYTS